MAKSVEHGARSNFGAYAVGAVRAEHRGDWNESEKLWLKAAASRCGAHNLFYANVRAAFCANALARRWSSPHAS